MRGLTDMAGFHNVPPRQTGITLVEVMITLLVVSVGLLAVASLQLLSKRSNYDAAQRTTAAQLADDLMERMRANPGALITYTAVGSIGGGTLSQPDPLCTNGVVCTPEELATYDLWQWEQQLDGISVTSGGEATGGLVSPIACLAGPGFGGTGTYTLAIAWRGLTDATNPVTESCGEGSGNYGDGDEYRRVLVMRTFINAG